MYGPVWVNHNLTATFMKMMLRQGNHAEWAFFSYFMLVHSYSIKENMSDILQPYT